MSGGLQKLLAFAAESTVPEVQQHAVSRARAEICSCLLYTASHFLFMWIIEDALFSLARSREFVNRATELKGTLRQKRQRRDCNNFAARFASVSRDLSRHIYRTLFLRSSTLSLLKTNLIKVREVPILFCQTKPKGFMLLLKRVHFLVNET